METSILAGIVREGGARSGKILCRLKIAQESCSSSVVCTLWRRRPGCRSRGCGKCRLLKLSDDAPQQAADRGCGTEGSAPLPPAYGPTIDGMQSRRRNRTRRKKAYDVRTAP